MIRVKMVPIGDDACGYYRVILPARVLKEGGVPVVLSSYVEPLHTPGLHTILFQRYYGEANLGARMRELRTHGVRVIYDLDDDLLNLPPTHPDHAMFSSPAFQTRIRDSVAQANVVTCSTIGLAAELRKLNPVVKVIPNCVDPALLPRVSPPSHRTQKFIGWAGSCTHQEDLMMVYPAIERIMFEYSNVVLFMMGFVPASYRALNSRLGGNRLIEIGRADYANYIAVLRKYSLDVGLVPLVPQKFNESKSVAKFLEYTLAGVPVIASSVGEYRTLPRDVAIFCQSNEDWYQALKDQVTSAAARYPTFRRALSFVQDCRTVRAVKGSWEAVCRGVV